MGLDIVLGFTSICAVVGMKHFIYSLSLILAVCANAFAADGAQTNMPADSAPEGQHIPAIPAQKLSKAHLAHHVSAGLMAMAAVADLYTWYLIKDDPEIIDKSSHLICSGLAALLSGWLYKHPLRLQQDPKNMKQKLAGYGLISAGIAATFLDGILVFVNSTGIGALEYTSSHLAVFGWAAALCFQGYARCK